MQSELKQSLVSVGEWVFPCASHVSFYFWFPLYRFFSWLTGAKPILDGLSHTSSMEMRYLHFYSVKISRGMFSGL